MVYCIYFNSRITAVPFSCVLCCLFCIVTLKLWLIIKNRHFSVMCVAFDLTCIIIKLSLGLCVHV